MRLPARFITSLLSPLLALLMALLAPVSAAAQAYAGHPKLIVIVVIDQFRGDYLNRDQSKFKGRGFRLFMDEGAWFTDCYYDYANTKTSPGHATIGTGAYSDGHGIESNEFWDASRSIRAKSELGGRRTLPTGRSAGYFDPRQSARRSTRRGKIHHRVVSAKSARYNIGGRIAAGHQRPFQSLRHFVEGSRRDSAGGASGQRCFLDRQLNRPFHHFNLLHGTSARMGEGLQRQ